MYKIKFKHADQARVYPKLLSAVNTLCVDKGKDANCVSGYRSLENQKATNKSVLQSTPGATQMIDGSIYNKSGQCLAAAYGKSNHCFGIAMDIDDLWFKALSNSELARYGLIKPMSYEPWHVELIETRKLKTEQKPVFYFQYCNGLVADGIFGQITRGKAKEMLQFCQELLGNDFKTAQEVIIATQSSPSMWIQKLNEVKYLDSYTMNIYKKLRGE